MRKSPCRPGRMPVSVLLECVRDTNRRRLTPKCVITCSDRLRLTGRSLLERLGMTPERIQESRERRELDEAISDLVSAGEA
jgi:hypothetical protein